VRDTGFVEQVLGTTAPVVIQKDLLAITDVARRYDHYFVVIADSEAAVWASGVMVSMGSGGACECGVYY
jgi:hypothetical protein